MEFKNITTDDMYFCKSIKQFHYLKANGFYYLFKQKNKTNDFYHWAFERTDELGEALKNYNLMMKNK